MKKLYLSIIIACLCVATIIGICAIFMEDLPDITTQILINTAIVGGFSIISLKPASLFDKGKCKILDIIGFIVAFIGMVYLSLYNWSILSIISSYTPKGILSLLTIIVALNLMYFIFKTDIKDKKVFILQIIIGILIIMSVIITLIFIWGPSITTSLFIKVLEVLGLLITFCVITMNIIIKMNKSNAPVKQSQ
ncbi:MAG: hypothetical protein PHI22_03790 [Bacilli bacterium]|nr:hypothetical protein [Bacilli bacterium]MDD4298725.1 hypothetical protein [Bacilli bacterium]MDD4643595.1 hypothetical protein [Bacilli bacterium]